METRRSPPGVSAVATTAPHLQTQATPHNSLFSWGFGGAGPPPSPPWGGRAGGRMGGEDRPAHPLGPPSRQQPPHLCFRNLSQPGPGHKNKECLGKS